MALEPWQRVGFVLWSRDCFFGFNTSDLKSRVGDRVVMWIKVPDGARAGTQAIYVWGRVVSIIRYHPWFPGEGFRSDVPHPVAGEPRHGAGAGVAVPEGRGCRMATVTCARAAVEASKRGRVEASKCCTIQAGERLRNEGPIVRAFPRFNPSRFHT